MNIFTTIPQKNAAGQAVTTRHEGSMEEERGLVNMGAARLNSSILEHLFILVKEKTAWMNPSHRCNTTEPGERYPKNWYKKQETKGESRGRVFPII